MILYLKNQFIDIAGTPNTQDDVRKRNLMKELLKEINMLYSLLYRDISGIVRTIHRSYGAY